MTADEITAAAAIIALFGAGLQILIGRHEARMALANTIYKDYLLLAFENPKFSSPSYPQDNPGFDLIKEDPEQLEKYHYFIAHLLFAAELILERTKNNKEWRNTLRDQLKYHTLFLDDTDFLPEGHYKAELLTLREEAIKAYKDEIRHE